MTPRGTGRPSLFEKQLVGLLDQLLGAAMRLERTREDAEDLVTEAVTKAWARRHALKHQERLRPWLFRILTNCFVSRRRRWASDPLAPVPGNETHGDFSLFERLHQPFLLWWNNPERELLNKLLRKDLEGAIDALPESYKLVFVLSQVEGLAYRDIAGILKIPVGTVRSRLSRGRSLLQKALWMHRENK